MRPAVLLLALAFPIAAGAQTKDVVIADVIDNHVLPRFADLAESAEALDSAAADDCDPQSDALRAAYNAAFDAWMGASHLRFGPTETDNRAFALAFWPDTRGATPKALQSLIADEDPAVDDPESFATVSIAARGFYGLELLLYDPAFAEPGEYLCRLIRAEAADIARTASAIEGDWRENHAATMRDPGPDSPYRDADEVLRVFYTALTTGLQMTSDTRLGRPLGSFERPRPARAEARRSGRSLRNVILSLEALRDLAARLATLAPEARLEVEEAFARALDRAARVEDPIFAGVAEPISRIRIEGLKQRIDDTRIVVGAEIAPALGIAAGFNSMDGD